MAIPVECPACEYEYSLPEQHGGQAAKCPECGSEFRAPKSGDIVESVAAADNRAGAPRRPVGGSTVGGMKIPSPKRMVDRGAVHEQPAAHAAAAPQEAESAASFVIPQDAYARSAKSALHVPRRKKSNAPLVAAIVTVGLLLLAAGSIALVYVLNPKHIDAGNPNVEKGVEIGDVAMPSSVDDDPPGDAGYASPPTVAQINELWDDVRSGVCKITVESTGESGPETRIGSGFVVDPRGWVATNLHLVEDAGAVEVTAYAPQAPYHIVLQADGVLAADTAYDLAILSVEFPAGGHLALELDSEAYDVDTDWLVACRQGGSFDISWLDACKLDGIVRSSNLPPDARAALRDRNLRETSDRVWLQFDIPLGEMDNGAPLLNVDGKVVGLTAHLSPTSRRGYAIPAHHLATLVQFADAETAALGPITSTDRLGAGGVEATGTKPMPSAVSDPKSDPLLLVDSLEQARDECEELAWNPKTMAEYGTLQKLAHYIHEATLLDEDIRIDEGLRAIVSAAAHEVLTELSQGDRPWPADVQLANLNGLAVEALKAPGYPVFAYIELVAPSRDAPSIEGQPSVVARLIGTDQLIVLPTKENPLQLKKGTRWLLLGMHQPMDEPITVEIDATEQPAALVQAMYLLGELEETKPDGEPGMRGPR